MKTFVVLGMHRSATSLAAKGLKKSGVHMGEFLLGATASNPYGHWEDVEFIRLNDKILKEAGGSWDEPPPESAILEVAKDKHKTIRSFISLKEREPLWGWKDPRTTLTIKCYMPYLTNPHFVVCFRDKKDVAVSLHKRNGMKIGRGIELANIYNERLLDFLQEFSGRVQC